MNVIERPEKTKTIQSFGPKRSWHAHINLEFKARKDRTVLSDMSFSGPIRVQRPFYPEGFPCHMYLLHPPGGMVSGDRIDIDINVLPNAHALLTTPSAGKIYGADFENVVQSQNLNINIDEGICEWFPQENILFNRANAVLRTKVNLTKNATFIAWDIQAYGRPLGDEPFLKGQLNLSFAIYKSNVPLLIENFQLDKALDLLRHDYGLMGFPFSGNFYIVVPDTPVEKNTDAGAIFLLEKIREILPQPDDAQMFAASQKPGIIIVRGLSHCAENLRNQFIEIWDVIRPLLLQCTACHPRIWST